MQKLKKRRREHSLLSILRACQRLKMNQEMMSEINLRKNYHSMKFLKNQMKYLNLSIFLITVNSVHVIMTKINQPHAVICLLLKSERQVTHLKKQSP